MKRRFTLLWRRAKRRYEVVRLFDGPYSFTVTLEVAVAVAVVSLGGAIGSC